MFLRSLYGSRMPQARHPRSNEQVSNYWRDDTESAREMARMMDEFENANNDNDDAMKKPVLPAMVDDSVNGIAAHRRGRLLNPALLAHVNAASPLDSLDTLNVDDMDAASLPAQLSPTGLISIAAADIDDASRGIESLSVHAKLDLDLLNTIRRTANGPGNDTTQPRQLLIENVLARMLSTSSPTSLPSFTAQSDGESPLRFLSLLRRINELRSQQVQQDADVWDGLPYPQILALPTFKYTLRERSKEPVDGVEDEHINNTMCAVCYTEYAREEEVRALPCLHFYHRECIDQWLMHHRMCPICKHIVAVY